MGEEFLMETEKLPGGPKWSLWDVGLVLIALFALIPLSWALRNVIRTAVLSLNLRGADLQSMLLFAGTLVQALVMILAVIILTRRKGAKSRDLGFIWRNPVRNILTGIALGLTLVLGVAGLGALISYVVGPPPPQDVERFLGGVKTGRDLLLPFLSISVLAPLSEELYFRGMAYPALKARFGFGSGLVLSALFFGAMHMDLYRLIPIGAGGLVLAYFYERTGTLLTTMVAHSTWNTLMLLTMYIAGKYPSQ